MVPPLEGFRHIKQPSLFKKKWGEKGGSGDFENCLVGEDKEISMDNM